MDTFLRDLRYGFRMLLRKPGFTVVAVVALALGIGANSAIFSVADALLLKPLPFPNLDRLVAIHESLAGEGIEARAVSPADFLDWQSENSVFRKIAAYRIKDMTITGTGEPELLNGTLVSPDFLELVGMNALKGRGFLRDESEVGRDQITILGYGLWQRRFGGDPNILGQTLTLNGRAATVVGIMPPNFDFPFGSELWMPLALTPQQMTERATRNLLVLAQLKPESSVAQAQAEMLAVAKRIEERYPLTNTGLVVDVIPLRDQQADFTRPLLAVMIGMAGLLLLIACANVANLLLARATTRQKEIGIRAALGASRGRVIRQLVTESLLLSCLAGVLGLILSMWAVDLIKASLPPDIARFMAGWKEIRIDGRVLAFTLGIGLVTTIVFSLAPALQASKLDLNETLKGSGRGAGTTARNLRFRGFLVVSEMALALVLLVGAGLMVKGFLRILNNFHGANPDTILTLRTPLPPTKYKDQGKVAEFYQQVLARMEALPGVQSAGAASNTPLNNQPNLSVEFTIEGSPPLPPGERQTSDLMVISPNYFKTLGIPLLSGRDFSEADGIQAPRVAIISDLMLRRYWPREDPVGRRIRFNGAAEGAQWLTVAGVVADVKQSWFDRDTRPQVYLPYTQAPQAAMHIMLRTSIDPMNLAATARAQIHSIDPDQLINETKTLGRLFVDEGSPFRFAAELILVLGVIALLLSALGVYSVMSHSVAQRTHEIGIRIALGAQQADVLRLIVGQGLKTAILGLAIGLPAAFVLSRVMASALYGIVAVESSVLISFVLILAAVASLSCYVPARRATKVDPMVALRHE